MFGMLHTQLSHNATAMGGAAFAQPGIGELREGAMGSAVKELQSKLNVLQYGPVTVDGNFGASTKQALMNFQQAEGVGGNPPSGILDAETEARLNQRVLSVSTGGGTGAQAPGQQMQPLLGRPWWQTALMVAGGIAIVGGVIYLLSSDESKAGYRKALNARTVEHDDSTPTRYKRTVRAHGSNLRGEKCSRSPDTDAFESGESLEVPS